MLLKTGNAGAPAALYLGFYVFSFCLSAFVCYPVVWNVVDVDLPLTGGEGEHRSDSQREILILLSSDVKRVRGSVNKKEILLLTNGSTREVVCGRFPHILK